MGKRDWVDEVSNRVLAERRMPDGSLVQISDERLYEIIAEVHPDFMLKA